MNIEFSLRRLSVLAYARGFTQWVYQDASTPLAVLRTDGYFSPGADMFAVGDHIHISAADGGTIVQVMTSSEAAGVTVRPLVFA